MVCAVWDKTAISTVRIELNSPRKRNWKFLKRKRGALALHGDINHVASASIPPDFRRNEAADLDRPIQTTEMDESWRMSIGTVIPRRRSTEQDRRSRCGGAGGTDALDADYFRDVFGGPPRSVLLRRFSGDARPASSFYEEIFRPAWRRLPLARGGRRLPGFRIPEARASGQVKMDEGFYDDIFGSDGGRERRSRSRSKCSSRSKSSSVLSSAELSPPLRPSIAEDAMLSSFASKLRFLIMDPSLFVPFQMIRVYKNLDVITLQKELFSHAHCDWLQGLSSKLFFL